MTSVCHVVVIGASAGGITPLIAIIKALPARLPAAVLVVQHLKTSNETTQLPVLIGRETVLPVTLATANMPLQIGHVYIARPGKHLRIHERNITLDEKQPVRHVRPSIDVLFMSAAKTFGTNVIGVILSGAGRDGADGCLAIKSQGGVVIAQNQESAGFFYMPGAAIATKAVDYVLPSDEIASQIITLLMDKPQ